MLYLDFYGETYESIGYPDGYFREHISEDCFYDDYVKKIVFDIDGSIVENPHAITHPYFGLHNCYEISTGAKNIILAYKTNAVLNADFMGDNCIPLLIEIAKKKDVYVTTTHMFVVKCGTELDMTLVNTGAHITTSNDYIKTVIRFLAEREEQSDR